MLSKALALSTQGVSLLTEYCHHGSGRRYTKGNSPYDVSSCSQRLSPTLLFKKLYAAGHSGACLAF